MGALAASPTLLRHGDSRTDCYCSEDDFLVFDPTLSPHFEVFLIPFFPYKLQPGHICHNIYQGESVSAMMQSEWPPSSYIMYVLSSRTGQWNQRSFVRQGMAAGTVADMQSATGHGNRHAAYWHGALYVHCQNDFVMRINLSDDKYQVIHMPKVKSESHDGPYLGKSEKGVYCTFLYDRCAFQIWFIDESLGQMEWMLKHDIDLSPVLANFCQSYGVGSWITRQADNYEALPDDNFEWDSDNDNVLGVEDGLENHLCHEYLECLGFHPYKEIVFFFMSNIRAVAYHLNSSKIQYMGEIPLCCNELDLSLPYTPCWMEGLPGYN